MGETLSVFRSSFNKSLRIESRKAREVAEQLLGQNEEFSLGIQALEDINAIFKGQRATKLGSGFLCDELAKLEYRKWPEYGKVGKPISQPQLANLLKRYRIFPKLVRPDPGGISGNTIRGYELEAYPPAEPHIRLNVRYGSEAEVQRSPRERPLPGAKPTKSAKKRTSSTKVCFPPESGSCQAGARTSAPSHKRTFKCSV